MLDTFLLLEQVKSQDQEMVCVKKSERCTFSQLDLNVEELCWGFLQGGDDSLNWETAEAARSQSGHPWVCEHCSGAKGLSVGRVNLYNREEHGI